MVDGVYGRQVITRFSIYFCLSWLVVPLTLTTHTARLY